MSAIDDKPEEGGFLSRWSRRKLEARQAQPATPNANPRPENPSTDAAAGLNVPQTASQTGTSSSAPMAPPPLPPLESLTPDADFSPFMAKGVEKNARNSALKTLFTDPHFNKMDGLDVYIDDYTQHTPIPMEMLRSLKQAQMLFADEKPDAQNAAAGSGVVDPSEAKIDSANANERLPALVAVAEAPALESPHGAPAGSGVDVESDLPIARQTVKNNP